VLEGGAGDEHTAATEELLVGGVRGLLLGRKRRRCLQWRREGERMKEKRECQPCLPYL